jgi:hypothetical protein
MKYKEEIRNYIDTSIGLLVQPPTDEDFSTDEKLLSYLGRNENGIVYFKYGEIIGFFHEFDTVNYNILPFDFKNPNTTTYSRFAPKFYPVKFHKNDMSLDNLIALATHNAPPKEIADVLLRNFFRYDDIYPYKPRWSRFLGHRGDFLYFIFKRAKYHKLAALYLPWFILARGLSVLKTEVKRPTIYEYLGAVWNKALGKDYSPESLKYKLFKGGYRYIGHNTSGPALTCIMLDNLDGLKWFKKWHDKRLEKFGGRLGLVEKILVKHGREDCKPMLDWIREQQSNGKD